MDLHCLWDPNSNRYTHTFQRATALESKGAGVSAVSCSDRQCHSPLYDEC